MGAGSNGRAGERRGDDEPGDAVAVRGRRRQQLRGARPRRVPAGRAARRRRGVRRPLPLPPLGVPPVHARPEASSSSSSAGRRGRSGGADDGLDAEAIGAYR